MGQFEADRVGQFQPDEMGQPKSESIDQCDRILHQEVVYLRKSPVILILNRSIRIK